MWKILLPFVFLCSFLSAESERLEQELSLCFKNVPREKIQTTILKGGYSGTQNFLLEYEGKRYVLRLYSPCRSEIKIERELYAHCEAAKRGVAPKIYYLAPDRRAILMEYLEEKSLTPGQVQTSEGRKKAAEAISRVHSIPRNPYDRACCRKRMEGLYEDIVPLVANKNSLHEVQEILCACYAQLSEGYKVTLHGDLNPHNVFYTPRGVLFIDWSDTNWDDPFYDLATFTAFQNYTLEEEKEFLAAYFQREVNSQEYARYLIFKKISLAHLCMTCQSIAQDLLEEEKTPLNTTTSPREWSYYTRLFADQVEEFTAQTFYEASQAALIESKKIPNCAHSNSHKGISS